MTTPQIELYSLLSVVSAEPLSQESCEKLGRAAEPSGMWAVPAQATQTQPGGVGTTQSHPLDTIIRSLKSSEA